MRVIWIEHSTVPPAAGHAEAVTRQADGEDLGRMAVDSRLSS
jgi:hypothetical protein